MTKKRSERVSKRQSFIVKLIYFLKIYRKVQKVETFQKQKILGKFFPIKDFRSVYVETLNKIVETLFFAVKAF